MQHFYRILAIVAVLALCASSALAVTYDPGNSTGNSTGILMRFPYCTTSALCTFCWQKQPTVCYQCMEGTFLQGNDCSQTPPYTPSSGALGYQVLLVVYALVAVVLAASFAS